MKIFYTIRNYKKEYLPKDLLTGIVIAAVSIPISMGYAEVSGLPAVYGLYGSVLPILFFALFSTSPQFIFGIDAAPAAIVGGALATLGISPGSQEALAYVPMIALFTGLWLLLFYLMKADKIVNFISTPVMGGFISGIALTIILMQIPKILGGGSGSGELLELLKHIAKTCGEIHVLSVVLGICTLIMIRISSKIVPKFPMPVFVMAVGVVLTMVFHVDTYGVKLLAAVEPGLPGLVLPKFGQVDFTHAVGRGLMVAVVVMSETLLSENSFASRNGYKIQDNQEILACAAGNLAAAFLGSCPVNGSISRTSMNQQFGGKTQVVSITAGITMVFILIFCSGFIGYLPVPVLTAIVISALMNVVEFELARRLYRVSRKEFYIFAAACLSVLILGTIYGVIIGIILSFVSVILRASNPPRTFRGVIPGREYFYDLGKNLHAKPIQNVVIYRFQESLFFANIKIFMEDIENSISENTKVVIVDASAVNSIDITAADSLVLLADSLKKRGIRFYLTEHTARINEELRGFGMGHLIEEGMVRRTVTAALRDAGYTEPYPLESSEEQEILWIPAEEENSLEEFAWAFGDEVVEEIEKRVRDIIDQIHQMPDIEELSEEGIRKRLKVWRAIGAIDEDEVLRRMELHMDELTKNVRAEENQKLILQLIEKRRHKIAEELRRDHPEMLEKLKQSRNRLERRLEKQNPEGAKRLHEWEEKWKS